MNQIKLHDCSSDLASLMLRKEQQSQVDLLNIDLAIAKLQRERVYISIAHACFRYYCHHGTLLNIKFEDQLNQYWVKALSRRTFHETEFNNALARYDFKYVDRNRVANAKEEYFTVSLTRLERNEVRPFL